MAQRRSLNRRWSRRSRNATVVLNDDSEIFDAENPMWWKNIEDATMSRPSIQTSLAETTAPVLDANSLVDESELQDQWWDNLDRTGLQSSRRFSTRRSVNPQEAIEHRASTPESPETSIRKRKVLLRARQRQSDTPNFANAFDDSDAVQSEPLPNKKQRTRSPDDSERLPSKRRSHNRHSRSLVDSKEINSSLNTTNTSDVVLKPRPRVFKKKTVAEEANKSDSVNDFNNSMLMRPPSMDSKKKRSSRVSRTLAKTSDESEVEAQPRKTRHTLQKLSQNTSFNPFDELLSGQMNDSETTKNLRHETSRVSSRIEDAGSKKSNEDVSMDEWNVPESQEDPRKSVGPAKSSTMIEESIQEDESERPRRSRRSASILKTTLRTLRSRNATIEETAGNEYDVPETQDEAGSSLRVTRSSNVEKSTREDAEDRRRSHRSSSVPKNTSRASRTRNVTIEEAAESEDDVSEAEAAPNKSLRVSRSSTVEKSSREPTEVHRRSQRSSSVLKNTSRSSRTRNATIEETGESEDDVSEAQAEHNKSHRGSRGSIVQKSLTEHAENHRRSQRSSSVLKNTSRNSRTRNATIEEDGESEDDISENQAETNKSLRVSRSSAVEKSSREQLEDHHRSQNLSFIPKNSSRVSAASNRNATIEESAPDEWHIPETQEQPKKFSRVSRNSTIIEETVPLDELPETQERSLRASSVNRTRSSRKTIDQSPEITDRRTSPKSQRTKSSLRLSNAENTRNQLLEDWKSNQNDEMKEADNSVHLIATTPNSSLINKSLSVSIDRLPSVNKISSREEDDTDVQVEEIPEPENLRRKTLKRSHTLIDSAYDVLDKERSPSPVITASENESMNNSLVPDASDRQPTHRSIVEGSKTSRNNISLPTIDSALNIINSDSHTDLNNDLTKDQPKTAGKSINKNVPGEDASDISISEELSVASKEPKTNLSRRRSREPEISERGSGSLQKMNNSTRSRQAVMSDESISEEEVAFEVSGKSRLSGTRKSSQTERRDFETIQNRKTHTSLHEHVDSVENISDADTEIAENDITESPYERLSAEHRPNTSVKNSQTLRPSERREESDESIDKEDSNLKSANRSIKKKSRVSRKSFSRDKHSKHGAELEESDLEEDGNALEDPEITARSNGKNIDSKTPNVTNRNKSTIIEAIADDSSKTIPSDPLPLTPVLTKLPRNTGSFLSKSNATRAQKNITDFFPSRFLQKNDNKTLDSFTSFDREKLDQVKKEVELKRQQMLAQRIQEAKKKEPAVKRATDNFSKKARIKENVPKVTSKPEKVVDKAYIVNGKIYKRPKLPRPKPWVTDRLYRHLWKQMEPKYATRTRIKSESFVEQLSEVVALTVRRKKYESYKAEVDALMKEMARLNIIKTRNDFYEFCYEYLPYDFRVKVTPMLLPGNVRMIPYDPTTLHTPILTDG